MGPDKHLRSHFPVDVSTVRPFTGLTLLHEFYFLVAWSFDHGILGNSVRPTVTGDLPVVRAVDI